MDRGDWQATVHGMAKSRTWPSDFHFHSIIVNLKQSTQQRACCLPRAPYRCIDADFSIRNIALAQEFSIRVIPTQGKFGNVWRHFWWSWLEWGKSSAVGTKWVGTRDAAKRSTMRRTAPKGKKSLSHVNSVSAGRLCSSPSKYQLQRDRFKLLLETYSMQFTMPPCIGI